jgi:PAS domain S-box-containing protein
MTGPTIRVLQVEDNPADTLLLRVALDADPVNRFAVTHVAYLRDALAALPRTAFDVVLLDLGLPDSQGLAAFEQMYRQAPDLPIIVFSGNVDEAAAIAAVRSGAQDYLIKGPTAWELAGRAIRYAVERQQLGLQLRASEARFRALIEHSTDGIVVLAANGTLLYESPSAERITGYAAAERIGKRDLDTIHPEDRPALRAAFADLIGKPGGSVYLTYRALRKDGSLWWVEATATNMLDEPGIHGIVINFRDITDRKQKEDALRESEARFATAFHTSPVSQSIIAQATNEILEVNEACCRLFGYSRAELLGATPAALNLWENPADRLAAVAELQHIGHLPLREAIIRMKSGAIRTIMTVIEPITWQGLPCFISLMIDVTERRQAELLLRASEEKYRGLMESLDSVVATMDRDGRFLYMNDVAARALGGRPEELIGKTMFDIFPEPIASRQLADVRAVIREDTGRMTESQTIVRDRPRWYRNAIQPIHDEHGQVAYALINATDIHDLKVAQEELRELNSRLEERVQERTHEVQAQVARLEAILNSANDGMVVADASGQLTQLNPVARRWLEEILPASDAGRLHQAIAGLAARAAECPTQELALTGLDLQLRAAPITGAALTTQTAVVTLHDVSQLKALDRIRTAFISNISHELRTPITTIKLGCAMMRRRPQENARYLEALENEANRLVKLVEDILQISRIESGRLELHRTPLNLDAFAQATITSRQPVAAERGLTLRYTPPAQPITVPADPDRLQEVAHNLIENAIWYTPAGGAITVSTGQELFEGRAWAFFRVHDTGMGIPPDELGLIFERFFRGAQPRAQQIAGSGLGLSIVKELVDLHDGRITVQSQVGAGATFTVWLPLP